MSRSNGGIGIVPVPLQFGPNSSLDNANSLPFQIKREHQNLILKQEIPPWLSCSPMIGASLGPPPPPIDLTTTPSLILQDFHQNQDHFSQNHDHHNPNPNPSCSSLGPTTLPPPYHHHYLLHHHPLPHISATALLQKASQMGAKSSTQQQFPFPDGVASTRPHQADHMTTGQGPTYGFTPSRDQLIHSLAPSAAATAPSPLAHEMMMMNSAGLGFDDMGFGQMLSHHHHPSSKDHHHSSNRFHAGVGQFSSRSGNEGENLTRDFLGLRPLSQNDILSITGLDSCINSNENQNQTPKSWQG